MEKVEVEWRDGRQEVSQIFEEVQLELLMIPRLLTLRDERGEGRQEDETLSTVGRKYQDV
jgi:hypothetical protein